MVSVSVVRPGGELVLQNVTVQASDCVSVLEDKAGKALSEKCTLLSSGGAQLPSTATIGDCNIADGAVLTAAVVPKSEVLIVGGGFAGLHAAFELARTKTFNVTLVDTKEYFEYTPGIMRAYMRPETFDSMTFKLKPVLERQGVTFVQGEVKELAASGQQCTVSVQETGANLALSFDFCILANGCSFNPLNAAGESLWEPTCRDAARQASEWSQFDERCLQGRREHVAAEHAKLKELEAKQGSVLVHGAGYLGVQLATDLKHFFPGLSVTIIDFLPQCLGPFPRDAVLYCQEYMDRVGIRQFYSKKFERTERFWSSIGLPNGVDLELITLGVKASNRFLDTGMLSTKGPGGGGWITFNKQLQVTDQSGAVWGGGRVYVAGDANLGCIPGASFGDWIVPPIPKTVAASQAQANLACKNIMAMETCFKAGDVLQRASLQEMKWPEAAGAFEISLGPEDGCCVKGCTWVKGSGAVTITGARAASQKAKTEKALIRRYEAGKTSSGCAPQCGKCSIS